MCETLPFEVINPEAADRISHFEDISMRICKGSEVKAILYDFPD
ncbi:hypothetical protein EV130_11541 [Rhizobium azibense]|uniref:Uncharacterized protein n=1 Tax=Rhizobium azibense TaxID=1136135 RepID=A0A4R3QAS0_9HYPH|nr:hypothetical protein EV130_11541 [Rhizobium azibense]